MLILYKYNTIYFLWKDIIFWITGSNGSISQSNDNCFYITYMVVLKILQ